MLSSLNLPSGPAASSTDLVIETTEHSEQKKEAGLRQAAQDFEATYIAQMLTFSGLDKALMSGGGEEVSAFTSFYVESFAEQIAEKGGFGLADSFYDRLLKLSEIQDKQNESNKNGEIVNVDFGKL